MSIVFDLLWVIVGIIVLLGAGEWIVRGAVRIATHLRVPHLLIGLTIIAFGTSAPELFVGVQAVLAGDDGIAIGNIVGSNIANILLVLGLPGLVAPIALTAPSLRVHAGVMIASTAAFSAIAYISGGLDLTLGVLLISGIVAYVTFVGWAARSSDDVALAALDSDPALQEAEKSGGPGLIGAFVSLGAGLVGLPIGAALLVANGADFASALGIRQEIVGLSIVSVGTSLPELATVWAATRNGEVNMAAGNVIGSNIFNILFVGGAVAVAGGTTFGIETRTFDLPVMITSAAILGLLVFGRGTIGWRVATGFLVGYFAYTILIWQAQHGVFG